MMAGRSFNLAEMTWPEVGKAVETAKLAIIPTGSCEQHGPHMNMDSDSAIAFRLAELVAEAYHPGALLAPVVPFGISAHHLCFPGTISLRQETFNSIIWDIVASLRGHGLSHFLIVNGHGGNAAALKMLAEEIQAQMDVRVAAMMYMRLSSDVIQEGVRSPTYGHACEAEASVGLFLAPHIVRADRERGMVRSSAQVDLARNSSGGLTFPLHFDELTTNGALGDASLASSEFGELIVSSTLERTLDFLKGFVGE